MDNATADDQPVELLHFRIADVSPPPDGDVLAAITAALTEAWPRPSAPAPSVTIDTDWRFGQRRWRTRQIPRRTWGR